LHSVEKQTIINLLYIIPLLIGIIIYYYREKRKRKLDTRKINNDGTHFIDKIAQLGYFQFTATEKLESLKTELKTGYEQYGELATIEINNQPVCNRLFSADAEYLFEEGGIFDMVTNLKPAFEIRKLSLDINDHFEHYQKNIANQWIIVNHRKYYIYDELDGTYANWELATIKLVSLLNQELTLQKSDEQFYCISGGNDGRIILLTSEQFNFLSKSNIKVDWRPYRCNDHA
jgi:hypothetical protein